MQSNRLAAGNLTGDCSKFLSLWGSEKQQGLPRSVNQVLISKLWPLIFIILYSAFCLINGFQTFQNQNIRAWIISQLSPALRRNLPHDISNKSFFVSPEFNTVPWHTIKVCWLDLTQGSVGISLMMRTSLPTKSSNYSISWQLWIRHFPL